MIELKNWMDTECRIESHADVEVEYYIKIYHKNMEIFQIVVIFYEHPV